MLLPNTRPMQTRVQRAVAVVAAMMLAACGAEQVTTSPMIDARLPEARAALLSDGFNDVVISQVYGGGGNTGATYQHDFVELHNRGSSTVSLAGMSIQYASAAGISWTNKVDLSGSIPGGGFFLVRLASTAAVGAVVGFDQTGSINMSGTAGKLILVNSTVVQTGACPTGVLILDRVAYGANSTADGCGSTWGNRTANLSNTTAALRADNGCKVTGVSADDFTLGAPAPRTSASAAVVCSVAPPVGPVASITLSPATANVVVTTTQTITAVAKDANNQTVASPGISWSSNSSNVATVSSAGVVTAVSIGSATITATSSNNITATATINVIEAPSLPQVRVTEIHYDNGGTDVGEAIEIEGPAGTNLSGWKVVLYNGNGGAAYSTRDLTGSIPNSCGGRGVVVLQYPTNGIQNGGGTVPEADGLALVNGQNAVVEFLSYEGTMVATDGPAAGMTSRDIVAKQDPAPASGTTLQRSLADVWALAPENFGGCNGRTQGTGLVTFSFSGRNPTDTPLPVGFQDQIFTTIRRGGTTITEPFTWSAVTPDIAIIDQRGVVTAKAAGNATFRVSLNDGTAFGEYTLPMALALPWDAPTYAGNTGFGIPRDGNDADEVIIERLEYTTSFSRTRNIPNWVSYNLEATHIVAGQDRCDCFTFDPELIGAGFTPYTTADYTGAGTAAGYGIDRGHLVRSFDRTAGALDNAHTFYFSNIVPQAADNNQGPWAALESYLGDLARFQNKEVYIIAGASGSKGTVKSEGRITIPEYMWKVAVVMPRNQGLSDFSSLTSGEVIAVVMPNVPGIRSVPWTDYKVTVDSVESLSKYNVLDLLPDQLEIALESNTKPPVARVNGPFEIMAGESVTLDASTSTDPDGDALDFAWTYGDGRSGTGASNTVRYDVPGTYTATVTVTDIRTLFTKASTTVKVLTSAQGLAKAALQVQLLGEQNKLNRGLANALAVKIRNAAASIDRDNANAAAGQIGALINELDALVQSGRVSAKDAEAAQLTLQRVIASLAYGL